MSLIELATISFRTPSLILLPLSTIPSLLYTFPGAIPAALTVLHALLPSVFPAVPDSQALAEKTKRSALLTDILGLSFSHNALGLLKIDTFKTGVILLSGLFLYDIWWVFGTEVVSAIFKTYSSIEYLLYSRLS